MREGLRAPAEGFTREWADATISARELYKPMLRAARHGADQGESGPPTLPSIFLAFLRLPSQLL